MSQDFLEGFAVGGLLGYGVHAEQAKAVILKKDATIEDVVQLACDESALLGQQDAVIAQLQAVIARYEELYGPLPDARDSQPDDGDAGGK